MQALYEAPDGPIRAGDCVWVVLADQIERRANAALTAADPMRNRIMIVDHPSGQGRTWLDLVATPVYATRDGAKACLIERLQARRHELARQVTEVQELLTRWLLNDTEPPAANV